MSRLSTEPRNASELHYLASPCPGAPTLADRLEHLAGLHRLGKGLPDNTASEAARAAWARREGLAAAAIKPPAPRLSAAPAAKPRAPAAQVRAPAAAQPAAPSYVDRLRASLRDNRLTPAAREGVQAELTKALAKLRR